ncbi:hypothetical protein ACOSQ3_009174 [Xanthoceras sorbifolium]
MESSSSSSSSFLTLKYDVFLSFRGDDTRHGFMSHLHAALRREEIKTFIDYHLRKGETISSSLLTAIEQSRISIVVFSKDYASSKWCLEELVKILERRKMYGQVVIPVFYGVEPSDVRKQTGIFGDAFAKHFGENSEKLQRWKAALTEAANLSGWDSSVIRPDSLLVEKIVQDVLKRLNDMSPVDDNSGLVGVNVIRREIELLLCNGSKHFCMVGIWGIGGIGKTTVAGALFNKMFDQFEGSYFIQNVREESEKHGLIRWQQEVFSTILEDGSLNIGTSVGRRSNFIKKRLGRKKILIVFDDVTDSRQIESFIKDSHLFCFGSRIIITTRDKHVLTICGANEVYELRGLFEYDALQLFNRYAFGRNHPAVDYKELSNKLVKYANGVPLALKVLGSFLLGRRKHEWESALNKLERIPHKDIQNVLKINIFLDIACFFKGEDKDLVRNIQDANGLSAEIGMSVLIDKSLIIVSDNTITMHDLLQEMGREIIRQESIKHPGKRSRLWYHEDIYHVLTKNMGTEAIKGISLDLSKSKDMHLNPHAFAKMHKLKIFELHNSCYKETDCNKVHDFQGLESEFTELTYLHWHGYPSNICCQIFIYRTLLHFTCIIAMLNNFGINFPNLKHINLSHSKLLISSPDFSAPNLESLNLEGCTNLLEISSFERNSRLVVLNLRECKSLASLPTTIHLKSLRTLVLSGCSNLKTFSEISCNVEELFLDETAIEELPSSSIEYLSRLVMLNLNNCSRLASLPSNICKLKSLEYLYLSGCSKLESLPDDLGSLGALKELEVEGTAIREVPLSVAYLGNLGRLSFEGCKGQDSLGLLLPPNLLLGNLPNLTNLTLSDCGITELPDSLGQLSSLKLLFLAKNDFQRIPTSILGLPLLVWLDISHCTRLQSLPALPWDTETDVNNCTELQALSGLSTPFTDSSWFTQAINFINCFKLEPNALNGLVQAALRKFQFMANVWWKEADKVPLCLSFRVKLICLICFLC